LNEVRKIGKIEMQKTAGGRMRNARRVEGREVAPNVSFGT